MIRISLLLLSLAGALEAQDFIRQIQRISNTTVIYDIPVSSSTGQVLSNTLSGDSAIFQLYATETVANNVQQIKKLDEKTVGTFLPTVVVQALSEDPYFPARTRADKPYGTRIKITGMQGGPHVPDYAKNLKVVRSYKLYDATTYLPTATEGDYQDTFSFKGNGVFTDNAITQRLPGDPDHPTKVSGEESFTVSVQSGAGAPVSELAKSTIQVWPVATATLEGLEEGKVYRGLPTAASIVVRDIYPKSVTYAQVYKGKRAAGTTGKPLPSTVVSYDTYLPQNANLALTDLNSLLAEDGEYTLDVLTITPFNGGAPELLTSVSFTIKRSIAVNALIGTME